MTKERDMMRKDGYERAYYRGILRTGLAMKIH